MIRELAKFNNGTNPKVLLLGNGINRAFGNYCWEELLRKLSDEKYNDEEWKKLEELPNPLLAIVATSDNIRDCLKNCSVEMVDFVPDDSQKELINKIGDCDFDAILTTNYTYEIEKSFDSNFKLKSGTASKYRYKSHSCKSNSNSTALYQYIGVNNADSVKPVWHIHGEAAKYSSMVLGQLYYGRLLSYVKDYAQIAIREYKKAQNNEQDYVPKSWVDYFLFGDVYIVGQGLEFSEMVLWWLICYKKQIGIGSITWFEPKMTFAKKELAVVCNVCVESLKTKKVLEENGFYVEYYEKVIERL